MMEDIYTKAIFLDEKSIFYVNLMKLINEYSIKINGDFLFYMKNRTKIIKLIGIIEDEMKEAMKEIMEIK